MARYTGPKTKIARKFGEAIFGPDKAFRKKELSLQGSMVMPKARNKKSDYGVAASGEAERRSIRMVFLSVNSRIFSTALPESRVLLVRFYLQYCETRLDNIIFRTGHRSESGRAARQLVTHRHVTVEW
jgi:small subunit ribosomal protein S4